MANDTSSEKNSSDSESSSSSSDDSSSSSCSKKRAYDYKEIKVNNYLLFQFFCFNVIFTFMYYFIEGSLYMGQFRI